jgi:hypothetical protein
MTACASRGPAAKLHSYIKGPKRAFKENHK